MTAGPGREISYPVDLCLPNGRLNPDAVGWSRHPVHRANLRGWGRTKRWEYWCVQTADFAFALTVSSIDYLALHTVWFCEFGGREELSSAIVPLSRGPQFPETSGGGTVAVSRRNLAVVITPDGDTVRLSARTEHLSADIEVFRPPGHESLGVVIPWGDHTFQYTVKDNTLPASGVIRLHGKTFRFGRDEAWAVLDHGRGRWPYSTVWNWGSGSGISDGRTVGLQFGGKWTEGTGMTENALCIDGRLSKIGEELQWEYDRSDWLAPWRVRAESGRVDLRFSPFHERKDRTQAGLIATEVHQCFGLWSGTVTDDAGSEIAVADLRGFAEEARMRW